MTAVCIIGGGFGGREAAGMLAKNGGFDVTVIDRRATSDFLPMLPDVLSGRAATERMAVPLEQEAERGGWRFVQDEALGIDCENRKVHGRDRNYGYDVLVVASGTETNFYGNEDARRAAFTLDDAAEAERLRRAAEDETYRHVVIVGGSYTGIEIATHLRRLYRQRDRRMPILIVEIADTILGRLPEWMKRYADRNLDRMEIEVAVDNEVKEASPDAVILADGRRIERPLLIWAAGVKASGCTDDLDVEKSRNGRLKVGRDLRIGEREFAVGDAALWMREGGQELRMAVQFALTQGRCAAANIVRLAAGKALRSYRPVDLGFIVPMANGRSCGRVLGVPVRGRFCTCFHYLMCVYRAVGIARKWRVTTDLLGSDA